MRSSKHGAARPGRKAARVALFDTIPAANPLEWTLSRPYTPDWLDDKLALNVRAAEERKALECKSGFGFDGFD